MRRSTLDRASEADLELASRIKAAALKVTKCEGEIDMLESGSMRRFISMARRISCALMRRETKLSLNQIGELVGVSHASAFQNIKATEGDPQTEAFVAEAWGEVLEDLQAQGGGSDA
jgi:chromosomal replication initiation ATPase DnaA